MRNEEIRNKVLGMRSEPVGWCWLSRPLIWLLALTLLTGCLVGPRPTPTATPVGDPYQVLLYADAPGNGSAGPGGRQPQIFSARFDGSQPTQLTFLGGGNLFPAWSPNGQQIAFVSGRSGQQEIWLMNADGSDQRQLTDSGPNLLPAWAPDGRQIAFTSVRAETPQIWRLSLETGEEVQLTESGFNHVPTWSPDGRQIAFWSGDESGIGQIWVMQADGSDKRQLTVPVVDSYTPNGRSANAPTWLSNERIVYWAGIEHQYGHLWIMNADGGNQEQLTFGAAPISNDNPTWAADGRTIFFDSSRNGRPELWRLDIETGLETLVLPELRVLPGRASVRLGPDQ